MDGLGSVEASCSLVCESDPKLGKIAKTEPPTYPVGRRNFA
jgi:hypothetical protein